MKQISTKNLKIFIIIKNSVNISISVTININIYIIINIIIIIENNINDKIHNINFCNYN